jgi:AhpD family alkylhydroperoxidase
MELHSAVFSDGKLMVKQEELIAVGISVAIRRSSCIRSHGSKAIEARLPRRKFWKQHRLP